MRLEVAIRVPLGSFELDVDFTIGRPVTGVFGASGAGKTSLLESVAGLRRSACGRIRLGDDVWLDSDGGVRLRPEQRRVGYVPQESLLFPHLDVRGNLLAGARRAEGGGIDDLLRRVCGLLELEDLLGRDVATLSGGERRRVALGRALCSAPRLLLLDEPLASLDLPLRRRLLPFLRRLRAELTTPMLLVSHDPVEVQALCDEIIVLREGRAVARGEPHRVLADPRVFPLALEEGFENVVPATVARHEGSTSVVRLGGDPGVEVVTLRADAEPGDEVLIGLPSSEIVLATSRPEGLSARNVLPARVAEITRVDHSAVVTVDLGAGVPGLSVEVVETTPQTLGLAVGNPVFLVVKATSCRLYGHPHA